VAIKNDGGQVEIDCSTNARSYGIQVLNCTSTEIDGSGYTGETYGFFIHSFLNAGLRVSELSTQITAHHIEIGPDGDSADNAGVRWGSLESHSETFEEEGAVAHHFYVHDIDGEVFYFGHGSDQANPGRPILDAHVYDIIGNNCSYDGIQFRNVRSGTVHDCTMTNMGTGIAGTAQSGAGIVLGRETAVEVYDCTVSASGRGIYCLNQGTCTIHNNLVYDIDPVGAGDDQRGGWGIQVADDANGIEIYNNTLQTDEWEQEGIKVAGGYSDGEAFDNIVCDDIGSGNCTDLGDYAVASNNIVGTTASMLFGDNYALTESSPAVGAGLSGGDCGCYAYGESPEPTPDPPDPTDPSPTAVTAVFSTVSITSELANLAIVAVITAGAVVKATLE